MLRSGRVSTDSLSLNAQRGLRKVQMYKVGDKVKWKWGSGFGEGSIVERFTDDVTRTIDGTEVTRNATCDTPAYLIEQDDGAGVLKSHSELQKAS